MMDVAGTDKDCVELVLMLLEKAELGADDVDFRKREERVQAGADENKGEQRDPGIQEAPAKGKNRSCGASVEAIKTGNK